MASAAPVNVLGDNLAPRSPAPYVCSDPKVHDARASQLQQPAEPPAERRSSAVSSRCPAGPVPISEAKLSRSGLQDGAVIPRVLEWCKPQPSRCKSQNQRKLRAKEWSKSSLFRVPTVKRGRGTCFCILDVVLRCLHAPLQALRSSTFGYTRLCLGRSASELPSEGDLQRWEQRLRVHLILQRGHSGGAARK